MPKGFPAARPDFQVGDQVRARPGTPRPPHGVVVGRRTGRGYKRGNYAVLVLWDGRSEAVEESRSWLEKAGAPAEEEPHA